MKNELIICSCSNAEHQLIFRKLEEDDEVYIDVHLVKIPFFQRVKYGIKYIFGYKSRYGAFDEIIIDKRHKEQFQRITDNL